MRVEYYHASEYGNGAKVAAEIKRVMETQGITVNVHHIRDVKPKEVPPADLYVFSSPGRFGKPIGDMRHFLKKIILPSGSRYAILATEMNPLANKENGAKTADGELGKCQLVIPRMDEMLQTKGLKKVADCKVFVIGIKGPLEDQWQQKIGEFVKALLGSS